MLHEHSADHIAEGGGRLQSFSRRIRNVARVGAVPVLMTGVGVGEPLMGR